MGSCAAKRVLERRGGPRSTIDRCLGQGSETGAVGLRESIAFPAPDAPITMSTAAIGES
jgi:hypothetical protein